MTAAIATHQKIAFDALVELLTRIFLKHGVSKANARILGANCAMCERDGAKSHGIFRMPGYIATLKSGAVDGGASGRMVEAGPAFLRIDAMNGFAQPALIAARPQILRAVRNAGCVFVTIRRSHHFSALWPDLEPFAERGLVALSMVAGLACVTPPGGRSAVLGTNPIAFATPVEGNLPLIFDLATSSMSNGDLRIAARSRKKVPYGTGVDSNGQPTDDPDTILEGGAMLPFGGHKGAALSLMVEIFATALSGAYFSREASLAKHPDAEIPNTGLALLIVDPARGAVTDFAARVKALIAYVRAAGEMVRLPSDRRYEQRAKAMREGISLERSQYEMLISLTE